MKQKSENRHVCGTFRKSVTELYHVCGTFRKSVTELYRVCGTFRKSFPNGIMFAEGSANMLEFEF